MSHSFDHQFHKQERIMYPRYFSLVLYHQTFYRTHDLRFWGMWNWPAYSNELSKRYAICRDVSAQATRRPRSSFWLSPAIRSVEDWVRNWIGAWIPSNVYSSNRSSLPKNNKAVFTHKEVRWCVLYSSYRIMHIWYRVTVIILEKDRNTKQVKGTLL